MLVLLGLLDIAAGLLILLNNISQLPVHLLIAVSAYLLLKAIVFWGDFLSILDLITGLYALVLIVYNQPLMSLGFGFYLVLKGGFSLKS